MAAAVTSVSNLEPATGGATKMPLFFVSHGSPMVAIEEDDYTAALAEFGRRCPTPTAIVVISAHYQMPRPVRISSGARPGTIHDFGGFPEALYRLRYPAPGAPALAREVALLLEQAEVPAILDEQRGFDHGVWVPLRYAFPAANIPVLSLSLPGGAEPAALWQYGAALAPLRQRGVLLVGSGGIVHNLSLVRFHDKRAPIDRWAADFDSWIAEKVATFDRPALLDYRRQAPRADRAVPTSEHFDPLLVVLGAATAADQVTPVFTGFHHGNLSMRSFSLG